MFYNIFVCAVYRKCSGSLDNLYFYLCGMAERKEDMSIQ